MTKFGMTVVVLFIALLLGVGYLVSKPQNTEIPISPDPVVVAPTEDTTTPPVTNEPKDNVDAGYMSGHVTIGPNCPVESIEHPCTVPPEAYSSRSVVVYKNDGTTIVKKGTINAEGNYKITLEPGSYLVAVEPGGMRPTEKKLVTIKAGQTVTLDFDIDTGIR